VRINTRTGPVTETPIAAPAWWVAAVYLLVALIAQMELLHALPLRGAQVSAVVVVVVWYALHSDLRGAAIYGLIAGLCEDALGTQTGAAWTLSTTAIAVVSNYLTRWFFADSIPAVAFVVVLATLLRRLLFWIVMALQGYPPGYAGLHFHEALWEAALNAAFAIAALLLIRRYEERRLQ